VDQVTPLELVSMAGLLLTAGHETTVNLIAGGLLALLRHPDQLAKLRARPELLDGAVEEFLRYDPPAAVSTMRFATERLELGGVTIPGGDIVLLAISAANRDGERFGHPDSLDIERPAGGHLSFGHGIHFCLGAPLARMEAKIALSQLIERFPAIGLAVDPSELVWRPSVIMHGLVELPVWLERRESEGDGPRMQETRLAQVKRIVCETLELDEAEVSDDSNFKDTYDVDSMQLIEIVAALEKEYSLVIRQADIERMVSLRGVYDVLEGTPG
jgi:acyl carrier protein